MRPTLRAASILLAACGSVIGCGTAGESLGPAAVPGDRAFRTDSTSYVATSLGDGNYLLRIIVQYRNTTPATIYLDRCFPDSPSPEFFVGSVIVADSWGPAWNPAWACVGHNRPIVVAPGTSRVDTIELRAPTAVDHWTQKPFGTFEGWFAVGFRPRSCVSETECAVADDSLRATNPFRISLPK